MNEDSSSTRPEGDSAARHSGCSAAGGCSGKPDAEELWLQLRRDHSRLTRLQQLAKRLPAEDGEALWWLLREYEKMAAILLD